MSSMAGTASLSASASLSIRLKPSEPPKRQPPDGRHHVRERGGEFAPPVQNDADRPPQCAEITYASLAWIREVILAASRIASHKRDRFHKQGTQEGDVERPTLARQPASRRLAPVVVGRLEDGLGKRGLDTQHGLAGVREAVFAAGRHYDELASGQRGARLADPHLGLSFEHAED